MTPPITLLVPCYNALGLDRVLAKRLRCATKIHPAGPDAPSRYDSGVLSADLRPRGTRPSLPTL